MEPDDLEALLSIGILLASMSLVAFFRKDQISWKWFACSLSAYFIYEFGFAFARRLDIAFLDGLRWNWSGMSIALFATLFMILALPATSRDKVGLRFRQASGTRAVWFGICIYTVFFLVLAASIPPLGFQREWETLAFQLTLPSLNEELFFRGLFLVSLDQTFRFSRQVFGAEMGWGAVISSLIFGLSHGLNIFDSISIDVLATAIPSLIGLLGCWVVARTSSLLGPILMHSFGNTIFLII